MASCIFKLPSLTLDELNLSFFMLRKLLFINMQQSPCCLKRCLPPFAAKEEHRLVLHSWVSKNEKLMGMHMARGEQVTDKKAQF